MTGVKHRTHSYALVQLMRSAECFKITSDGLMPGQEHSVAVSYVSDRVLPG